MWPGRALCCSHKAPCVQYPKLTHRERHGSECQLAIMSMQACMALRNAVARSPDLRGALLAAGAEPLLRAAQRRHPAACADVGAAALRDLGLEDYLLKG